MDRNMVLIGVVIVILFALFFLSTSSTFSPAPASIPAHLAPGLDPSKLASGAVLHSDGKDCSQFGTGWVKLSNTMCKKT